MRTIELAADRDRSPQQRRAAVTAADRDRHQVAAGAEPAAQLDGHLAVTDARVLAPWPYYPLDQSSVVEAAELPGRSV